MLAWWHSVPKPPKGKKKSIEREAEPARISRMRERNDAGREIDLPPMVEEVEYLIETLFEAGPVSTAGMGAAPLTWSDLAAWEVGTGIALAPWESRLVRKLSAEYLNQSQLAEEQDCPPPWQAELTTEHRQKVAAHIKSVLRG